MKEVTGVQRTLPKLPVAENILKPAGARSPEEISLSSLIVLMDLVCEDYNEELS